MPELPEVETMRRGIAAVAGCTIRAVQRPSLRVQPVEMSPRLAFFRRRSVGRQITAVGRLGKRIVLDLDSGDAIVIEPRMSGLVLLGEPPDRGHLHLVIELSREKGTVPECGSDLEDGATLYERAAHERGQSPFPRQLLFWDQRGLGVVRLVTPAQRESHYGAERIGPDALEISVAQLRERLGSSRRAIKVALLDQRAVAGIGNIYASESLHRAGIHPTEPCNRLSPQQWTVLCREIRKVLREAIRRQGSTLRDMVYRNARGEPGEYRFRVYQRTGQSCLHCGQVGIVRIVQAQRSTFFCPACQPASPPNIE